MNNKALMSLLSELVVLSHKDNSRAVRRKIRKVKRQAYKIAKTAAKAQAKIAYNQTYQLYEDIIKSNLE